MIIKRNSVADNSARMYKRASVQHKDSAEKLITGFQINQAKDNVAYFEISEKMRSQIRGLAMADRNCQDGISMIQTASGTLGEADSILLRGRELAVQASNDTLSDSDRAAINDEIVQIKEELERMNETTFNEISLFAESNSIETREDEEHNSLAFQVGPLAGQYITVHLFSVSLEAMGIDDTNVITRESAESAIQEFDDAMGYLNAKRSYYGAVEGRLGHALDQVEDYSDNMTNAETRIR
ncbi:MAG: flagellin [Lachnospiraceae bacterium]|nr:flagellin [Lachnospiraceae bacterium]